MNAFNDVYRGRRVLVTGHTGFKGSWLVLWLQTLGAKVTGIALPPETKPNHWNLLKLGVDSYFIDIRDAAALRETIALVNPEIVFHLAAQSLVRRSYREPLETWATNVLGTANLLDACRALPELASIVVVTSDKCYENREWAWGYREIDPLGGHDPYSASKAGTELVVASFRRSFFDAPGRALLASARAGNVIGGGDWSEDRLMPDLIRAITDRKTLEIRSPKSTRPWQHVLECLSGYLALGQKLTERDGAFANAWNFGPNLENNRSVESVLAVLQKEWPELRWRLSEQPQPHEAKLLQLDSSKAREFLHWRPVWNFEESVAATVQWYRAWAHAEALPGNDQINAYTNRATLLGLPWAPPGR